MKIILETERLALREFTLDDASFIIALLNTPGWLKYIGDRNVKSVEDAKKYLQNGPMKSYEENGFGLMMVLLKEGMIPAGMCGIIKRASLEHPDIGFAFLPQFTGKGYATEIATATMDYAKNKLQLPVIFGITLPENIRSIQLLEKSGLQFEKNIIMDKEELMLFKG
ncbi:MAG: GNAT family N-acetyltransferase [Bacteroidota bacterium]